MILIIQKMPKRSGKRTVKASNPEPTTTNIDNVDQFKRGQLW